jgi:hypothetical protein
LKVQRKINYLEEDIEVDSGEYQKNVLKSLSNKIESILESRRNE